MEPPPGQQVQWGILCSSAGRRGYIFSGGTGADPGNGGKIYEELIKRKKINTKLKKYDKIIARNIKIGVEDAKTYTFEIEKTGMHSNIRKILSKIMYG